MGRLSTSLLVLLLGATATVALASCGGGDSSGLLPGATASEINSNLDQVQQLVAEGDCVGAEDASAAVSGQIDELAGADKRLKEALSEGAARLNEVVATCEEAPDEEEDLEALEDAEAAEEEEKSAEKKEKKEKPKPEKEKEQKEAPTEPDEPPAEEEKEVTPPEENGGGTPSGGVGPATPAEGE
jgi:septal ring factor EnvC (AmiA/AmiB activator)